MMQLTKLHNTCSMKELGNFSGDESAESIKGFIYNSFHSAAIIANVNRVETPQLGSRLRQAGFKRLVSWRNWNNERIVTYVLTIPCPMD